MEDKTLSTTQPSFLLWMAVAVLALLSARCFLEYLRRVHHVGARRAWRETLLGAFALECGLWSAMIIGIASQGVPFDVGYSPVRVFGVLFGGMALAALLFAAMTRVPPLVAQLLGGTLLAGVSLAVQMGVIWSVGAAPGITWRREPLAFAVLVLLAGHLLGVRRSFGSAPGARDDRSGRRLLTGLLLAVTMLGAQELVLLSADLPHQVVSAYARQLPEIALALLAGAGVPIALVVMLVDQRMQQRARHARRRRRRSFYESRQHDSAHSSFGATHEHASR